jgi:hypothetical protein
MTMYKQELDAMSPVATTELCQSSRTLLHDVALRILGEALFWLIILQLITGFYLQSQLAMFDGDIVISNGVPKLLLVIGVVLFAALACLLQRGQITLRSCMLPACIFACYLVADLVWLLVTSTVPTGAILAGFNKYFLFFATIPAAALLRPLMSEGQMRIRFVLLLFPLVAVSIAQYALNDPLLPVASEDGTYEIPAIDFYGQTRAFSLYRSVLECGQGMAFFGALALAQLVASRRHALWNLLLLTLAAAACYATFRRGAYMEFSAAAIAAVAISRHWGVSRWLPWVYFAIGLALATGGTLLSSVDGEGIMSWESLAERHDAWTMVLEKWLLREDASLLFGTGLAQIESDQIDYFLVDNGFLAVGAQLGLVGLGLWCWVMHALWRDLLATAWRTRGILAIAVASLLSTWMMRAVFDPLFALYPLYAFLIFWTDRDTARAARAVPPATRVPRATAYDGDLWRRLNGAAATMAPAD